MFPRSLGHEIAVVAVLCTIAIFFFPAASGPYSAVHGPVTSPLNLRMRLRLRLQAAMGALQFPLRNILVCCKALRATWQESAQLVPPEQISVLRC